MSKILVKVSGESINSSKTNYTIDPQKIKNVAIALKELVSKGHGVAVVIGGGNIWRGEVAKKIDFSSEEKAHYMGMTATILNAVALTETLIAIDQEAITQTALSIGFVDDLDSIKAQEAMADGKVVVFAGGTGRPFVTTDSGTAERSKDISADIVLMGKNGVDGVYDSDPRINPHAMRIDKMTYSEIIDKKLLVMDIEAAQEFRKQNVKLLLFNINNTQNIVDVIDDESIATVIKEGND